MTPINENDLDRISDKVELAVIKAIDSAMEKHCAERHSGLEKKVENLNSKVLLASGVFAAAIWALEHFAK